MAVDLEQLVDEVSDALANKLRVRGRSLDMQIHKAGRLLPRRIRQDAIYLAQGEILVKNPKMAKRVDLGKASRAHHRILAYVDTVDVGAQRRDAAVNLVASIAFALVVTGCLLLFVLWQRGFV